MNYELFCIELLSQDAFLQVNKKLLATLGLEKAVYISLLINNYKYYKCKGELKNGYFYMTDNDICLYGGLKLKTIQNLKKECIDEKFIFIIKEGIPLKTFYKINFYKIFEIFNSEKEISELNYERVFKEEINIKDITFEKLELFSLRKLQMLCKKYNITYHGISNKKELIFTILEKIQNKNTETKKDKHLSKDEVLKLNYKNLRNTCKILKISYSGTDNKESLQKKVLSYLVQEEVDKNVCKKSTNKCTSFVPTSEQFFCRNQKLKIKTNKENLNYGHDTIDEFEELLNKWGINFTTKNQNSIKRLLKTMPFSEVKKYLVETYENIKNNPNVTNIPALFSSKIEKGERQSKFIPQKMDKKELGEDKKEWLKYFSGIYSDQKLRIEIENIITNIPFETLKKNKSKLSKMDILDFKNALYKLKNQNL